MQDNPYGIEALWQQSDFVIMSVAVLLLIMSITSWTIIVMHSWRFWRLRQHMHKLTEFWHTQSFPEAVHKLGEHDSHNPFRHLAEEAKVAMLHYKVYKNDLQGHLPLAEWLSSSLRAAIDESAERLQRGLSVLASVGSTAPFIGLLGTVWGIYYALVSIGVSGQASIDRVAGPVGEALIMTAFGLAVAIPAVLAYNALLRGNKGVLSKLNRFAYQLHVYLLTGAPPIQQSAAKVSQLRPKTEAS